MSAPAFEEDTANIALIEAYPRDVIIQSVYEPLVNHPIVYALTWIGPQ